MAAESVVYQTLVELKPRFYSSARPFRAGLNLPVISWAGREDPRSVPAVMVAVGPAWSGQSILKFPVLSAVTSYRAQSGISPPRTWRLSTTWRPCVAMRLTWTAYSVTGAWDMPHSYSPWLWEPSLDSLSADDSLRSRGGTARSRTLATMRRSWSKVSVPWWWTGAADISGVPCHPEREFLACLDRRHVMCLPFALSKKKLDWTLENVHFWGVFLVLADGLVRPPDIFLCSSLLLQPSAVPCARWEKIVGGYSNQPGHHDQQVDMAPDFSPSRSPCSKAVCFPVARSQPLPRVLMSKP